MNHTILNNQTDQTLVIVTEDLAYTVRAGRVVSVPQAWTDLSFHIDQLPLLIEVALSQSEPSGNVVQLMFHDKE